MPAGDVLAAFLARAAGWRRRIYHSHQWHRVADRTAAPGLILGWLAESLYFDAQVHRQPVRCRAAPGPHRARPRHAAGAHDAVVAELGRRGLAGYQPLASTAALVRWLRMLQELRPLEYTGARAVLGATATDSAAVAEYFHAICRDYRFSAELQTTLVEHFGSEQPGNHVEALRAALDDPGGLGYQRVNAFFAGVTTWVDLLQVWHEDVFARYGAIAVRDEREP